jgi:hypothetical protein
MRNVTISLDERVARWARIRAAEEEKSLSRWVSEMLERRKSEEEAYETAMRTYLSIEPRPLREAGAPLPRREDLHERGSLR